MRFSNNWIDSPTLKELKAKTFPRSAIVFPKIGAALLTNKKRMLVRDSVIDNNVMAVVVDDGSECFPDYLYQWFLTLDLGRIANPGTVPSLTSGRLEEVALPLPPLPEQRKIAAVLGLAQEAIQQQARLIGLTTELKKALLHKLFTEGLRGEPQKQTEIGPAPADLARWSRSPLRPLLDRAAQTVDPEALKTIAKEVYETTSKISKLPELADVVGEVNDQLTTMVGEKHAVETALGFAPTEPDRLLRALQLMIDGGKRGIAEASLGSANVLYLALKELEHQYLVDEGERQHTLLAIEEPEAHLHPHLQRLIYRNYLQTRDDTGASPEPRTIFLTTHSPNVASVAPLSNIVVLRRVSKENHTIGKSLRGVKFKKREREDLERYIDVTRGEIFFSKAVILVEGDSEKFLLPTLAKLHDPELDFDALGITVCSIAGTNFVPYTRLLGSKGLDIPFVVLTDYDPKGEEVSQEDADPEDKGVGR